MQKNFFHSLTWDHLERWTGKRVLDRGKGYLDRVMDLAVTPDNQLIATVEGQEYYLTEVWSQDGGLRHRCSCPYVGPCKHAVAVVLAYLEKIRSGKRVPEITSDELEAAVEAHGLVGVPDDELDSRIDPEKVRIALERIPVQDILEWAANAIADHAVLRHNLPSGLRQEDLETEKPEISAKTIARIRQEIRLLTRERVYRDDWHYRYEDDDHGPDYSSIKLQFGKLLDAGHIDTLIGLGEELFVLGSKQIDESGDDGDISFQIAECLKKVFEAVRRSAAPAPDRLIRYWGMLLEDTFGLLYDVQPPVDEKELSRANWLRVAEEFKRRLGPPPEQEGKRQFFNYRRKKILNRAIEALIKAEDTEHATELMVSELPHCGNHIELVDHLLDIGEEEPARHWAMEGFRQVVDKDRHIASGLVKKLQEVETRRKNWTQVAALETEFFFMNPDTDHYRQTRKACRKSGHWEQVRPFLLNYLETGQRVQSDADWPLPETDIGFPKPGYLKFPNWNTLISVALEEKRLDDAVSCYREAPSDNRISVSAALADAVRMTHPDVTLDIWKGRIESLIGTVKVNAYRDAMRPLANVRKLLEEIGREADYRTYIAELRKRHRPKRKLMEELDFLERKHRKILEG